MSNCGENKKTKTSCLKPVFPKKGGKSRLSIQTNAGGGGAVSVSARSRLLEVLGEFQDT